MLETVPRDRKMEVAADLERVHQLVQSGNSLAALDVLNQSMQRNPDTVSLQTRAAALLMDLHRYDEADAVLAAAQVRFPNEASVWIDRAQVAQVKRDWAAMAVYCQTLREQFPKHWWGYAAGGRALTELKQFPEAEAVIAAGLIRFPDNSELLGGYCWQAHHRHDWPEAARRWALFRERFPDLATGYATGSVALREAGRLDEAEAVLQEGLRRHPENAEMVGNFAWVAHARRDWPEALKRWQAFQALFPDDIVGYSAQGIVLRELRCFDEADAILAKGLQLSPTHPELIGNYAWVASSRHDWPEALKRWQAYRDLFPDHALGHYQTMLALGELGRFDEAAAITTQATKRDSSDPELAKFMLKFESLGDNCEFGVVQRHFGAEPLGLLRFTSTPPRLLTAALNQRFAGVGEPDFTTLTVYKGEYLTADTRFHMAMHTFIRESGDDREKRFQNVCRRLRYLRDKLIKDLEEGEKIFVYGCADRLDDSEISLLWRALREYGRNRLLFVRPEDERNAAGTVRVIETGLVVGYLERLSIDNPAFPVWLDICRQADVLLRENG